MPSKPPTVFPFRPHGAFLSRVEDRLMITDVNGPWNKELVEQWARAAGPVAAQLGPHVGIAVIHGSMLCPPDALPVLRQAARHARAALACVGHAIVAAASVEGRDFVEPNFIRAYDGVLPLAIFYTLDEARAWALARLAEQGY
jgi:hypothetical protein